jgi:hypothetical protein
MYKHCQKRQSNSTRSKVTGKYRENTQDIPTFLCVTYYLYLFRAVQFIFATFLIVIIGKHRSANLMVMFSEFSTVPIWKKSVHISQYQSEIFSVVVSNSITRKGNPSRPGNNHMNTQHIGYFHKELSQIPGQKQV